MDAKRSRASQVWRERVVTQQASGESVRAWCRAHGCHEHGFYWWRARLGLSPRSAGGHRRRRRHAPVAFTEVVIEPRYASAEAMTLRLRGGRELLLPPSMPVAWLAELVRAVEGASS